MSLGLDTILAAGIMGLVTCINSLPLEKTSYQLVVVLVVLLIRTVLNSAIMKEIAEIESRCGA